MILKYSIQYFSRMIGAPCTCFSPKLQLFKVIHCIYCILENQLDFPPFQMVFYRCSQYHQYSYRVGRWGRSGSHEVAGKGSIFTKNREMTTTGAIFTSTCHTKQLNPWPNSSASRVVIHSRVHSRLSTCQRKMGPFKGYRSTRVRQTGLRKRPE